MRRTLTYVWSLLCLCFITTTAVAQNGLYDVRFAIKNFDCAKDSVTIQVQVKSRDAAHTFLMGDANYRFDYDPRVIKNPQIVSQENFSNLAPSSDPNYTPQNLNGSSAGLTLGTVSLNTIYGSGGIGAKAVSTSWMTVSCIRFKVQDPTKCISLVWHDNNRFPITGMNEVVLLGGGEYDLYVVDAAGIFGNYSECIPSVCNSLTALNDINVTPKNTPTSGNLLTNDISSTTMTATVAPLVAPLHGVLTIGTNGAYTYAPTTGFVGKDSARYKVCNAAGICDSAWLFVTIMEPPVSGVNSNPIANPDNGVTYINTPLTSNVLTNDIDPDGNTLTVNPIPLVAPKNGTLVLNPNGSYVYTPNNAFVGQDTFYYKVCDNGVPSKCDSTSVVVNVLNNTIGGPGNLPPTPNDDAYETYKNITLTGNLKLNDSDPNVGQLLKYDTAALVLPLHGTVKIDSTTGIFTYIPTAGYVGPDEFVYRVCDNFIPKLCSQATAHIVIVNAPNDKPVVTVTPQTVGEDTTKTFCLPIVDPNVLDTHTVTACTAPTGGGTATAVVDNTLHTLCVTYKSAPNYNGQDTLCFIVCDNGTPSKCDTVKIPVTVTPINDKPVITVTPITIKEDSIVTFCMPFTDPDVGQTYSSTLCGVQNGTATTTIVGNTVCVTYTPTLNYNGVDTVCVIVCDNGVPSKCDTVKVPITITPVNDKPVITVVTPKTTVEDSTIIICTTITDPDGASVFTASMCGVQNGTAVPSVSGNQLCITYTPTLNYNGPDTLCVIVCDNGVPSKCDTLKIPITVTPVNDKPVVTVTPVTIKEDSVVTFCMPITDPDVGQTHTSTPCGAGHGTVTSVVTAGQVCVTYTPTTNYNGADTVCVIVCDNGNPSKCDTVKVPITITPVNDKPVITVVTPKTTVEDSTIIICTTITDPDGGTPVFAASICGVQHGTATPSIVGNQLCITYTPTLNYNGPDTLCVIVCDNGVPSKCDTLKIPITVTPVNDKPVVTITPVTVKEDTIVTVCFPITDPDVGQTFTSTPCGARNGTVTSVITAGQVCVTYTPTPNFYGTDTICVIVCDNGTPSKCDTAKIPVTVTPVNDKPIVPDATTSTPNTTPTTLCVPITDADPLDSHTLSLCGAPTMGSISGVVNNVTHQLCVTYTPTAGAVGKDSVCIIICDNGTPSKCDTTILTFNIGSTNDKPVATNDINITMKNTPVSGNVKTNDSDPNFNTLTVNSTPVLAPTNGTIVLLPNGNYVYTPNPNFVGTEIIKYQVCDNGTPSLCDTASLVIEVREIAPVGNQAPVANDDNTSTPAGQPIVIAVKANDFDPQGGTIGNPTIFGTPVGGTPTVNPDGTVTFVPTPGFVGDAMFKYYVCDNGTPSLCDSATVTVIVYPNPTQGNVAPVAIDDAYPVTKDTPFTGTVATNDYDQNAGQTLSYSQVTLPTRGTVTLLSNGQVTFVPTTGFVGVDSFKYKVCDSGTPSLCDTAVVIFTITAPIVQPTNVAPVATDDITTTIVNTPVVINVKANDYDPNGGQTLTNPNIIGTPVGGTALVNPNGTVTFVPTPGFTGVATFTYQVCDNGSPVLCDNATVTVNVIPAPALTNRPPVAGNDAATTPVNTLVISTVATNDSDPDAGQTLTFMRITPPENGVVTINAATGAYQYTPLALFVGIDSFQYKVCDNGNPSLCDTAWVFVTISNPINSPNVAPTANDDNSATQSGTPVVINVKANDFDLNPNTVLTNPTIIGTPTGGTTVVNPNGTVTFTPNPGFTGTATFKYAVCDNGTPSLCDTATVTVDVTAPTNFVNIAPIAINDATTTPINTPVLGNAKTNDSDINVGQTLTYATTPVTNPLHGSIVLRADGTYTYTPTTGFVGLDSAQYRVCDNGTPSLCATAWIVIDITAAGVNNNLPPVVTNDNAGTTKDVPVIINVKANDYDPNTGQTLGLPTIVGTVPNGTATVNPDGTITFTPTPGFTGTTTFTYQVCDNGFPSACGTATVTVVVGPTPPTVNINLAPVAVDDAAQTLKNTLVAGNVITNDTDPNAGQTLTASMLTPTTNGIVSLNANGSYTYTPRPGFTGTDQFMYKICDNGTPTMCDTATVYITIYDFPCVTFNLKVLLEGSLFQSSTAGIMRTTLNERGLLPGQTPIGQFAIATPAGHPYTGAPWNVTDTTGTTFSTYDPNVTDWVLVSLRTDNVSAINVLRVPALLMKDGTVRFINPCFTVANGNYFIVVEHRNHMGVMSPSAVPVVNGVINFDFTTGNSLLTTNVNNPPAFGQKLVNGKWAMYTGESKKNTPTTNFDINFNDSQLWKTESGIFDQYRQGDHDMNADVNFQDQVLWKANNGRYSIIPH
jgi:large repetitive protein